MQGQQQLLRRRPQASTADFNNWMREVLIWRLIASLFWSLVISALLFTTLLILTGTASHILLFVLFLLLIFVEHCALRFGITTVERSTKPWFIWRVASSPRLLIWWLLMSLCGCLSVPCLLYSFQTSQLTTSAREGHLGEGLAFALFYGTCLGAYYGFDMLRKERYVLPFPSIQKGRVHRLKATIGGIVGGSSFMASILLPLAYSAYFVFRLLFFRTISDNKQSWDMWMTNSLLGSLPSQYKNMHLAVQLWLVSLFALICWELSYHILVIIHTERLNFGGKSESEANSRLREGLMQKNAWMKYLAFLDLYTLSSFSRQRRIAIFADHTGESWRMLANQCCTVIDSCTARVEAASAQFESTRSKGSKTGWLGLRSVFAPSYLQQNQALFPDYQLLLWSVIGISKLCASSREEDRYGVVQSSEGLQGVLSSLLACLIAVEKYTSLPIQLPLALPHLDSHQVVAPQPHALAAVLHNGVYILVTAFYEEISALSFPPKFSSVLQAFVNFAK